MLAAGLAASLVAGAANAEQAEARRQIAVLPKRAETEAAFVPRGWAIEQRLDAALDGDASPDEVLVLLQQEDDAQGDRERALVVLLRRAKGFVLGGSNVGLLPYWGGGGVKGGDGAPTLTQERGVFVVDQLAGSREYFTQLSRFRWSRARGCFELIGEDTLRADSLDGSATSTSCNLLTRRCEHTRTPPQLDSEGNEREAKSKTTHYQLRKRMLARLEQAKRFVP